MKIFGVESQLLALILCSVVIIFLVSKARRIKPRVLIFVSLLIILLLANFCTARINGVPTFDWLRESSSFLFFPILLLAMSSYSEERLNMLFNSIAAVGCIEFIGIFISSWIFGTEGRATNLFGTTFISHAILIFEFVVLRKFRDNFLLSSLIILIFLYAYSLTGSRGLLFSSLLLLFSHVKVRNILGVFVFTLIASFTIEFSDLPILKRDYNLSEDSSSLGKFGEIEVLFNWFKENPYFGRGIGSWYNNGVDLSDFNYSHNMILFFLGYTGIFLSVIYFIIFFIVSVNYRFRYLMIAIILFYLSATTYTSLSFSIFLSISLLISLFHESDKFKKKLIITP
jgi:hypothetical protein